MGLTKFVSLFTTTSSNNNNNNSTFIAKTTNCKSDKNINSRISLTYNSELDIYGNSQRFKKSLLWSSLRKPQKYKGK